MNLSSVQTKLVGHLLVYTISFLIGSCSDNNPKNPLETVLISESPSIKKVMENLDQHEVQIRYTQIDRRKDDVSFTDYDFQVDKENYFYPASTVKFPAAVAALEKLNQLDTLSLDTRFYIEGDSVETTFGKAILEIFAVSDNAANNRLIEFLGQDDLNSRIQKSGVGPFRVVHRLSTVNADDVTTKPLVIYLNDSTTSISKSIISSPFEPLDINKTKKGHGFYDEDSLVEEPFDFSLKNYFPIQSQYELLKRIVFPATFSLEERFNISESQRKFLLKAMGNIPREVGYDSETYYDSYVKFFMFGDTQKPMPDHIRIYNKVGYAYGTLTDCAYIKDTKNNIDFMVTATILVNSNGIFNDDTYDYDEVGVPFLAQLGRELYEYELNRKR